MPLQLEPVVMLSTVPGEVAYPVAVAMGGAIASMARGIVVLYNNGRKDTIDSISALKDAARALEKVTESNHKQADAIEKLSTIVQEDRYRRASGG